MRLLGHREGVLLALGFVRSLVALSNSNKSNKHNFRNTALISRRSLASKSKSARGRVLNPPTETWHISFGRTFSGGFQIVISQELVEHVPPFARCISLAQSLKNLRNKRLIKLPERGLKVTRKSTTRPPSRYLPLHLIQLLKEAIFDIFNRHTGMHWSMNREIHPVELLVFRLSQLASFNQFVEVLLC